VNNAGVAISPALFTLGWTATGSAGRENPN